LIQWNLEELLATGGNVRLIECLDAVEQLALVLVERFELVSVEEDCAGARSGHGGRGPSEQCEAKQVLRMSERGRDTSSSMRDASESKRASHRPGYGTDLAYVHHTGYADFVLKAAPGLLRILRQSKLRRGLVVDLGCGGGLWARELARRGYDVFGVDTSPAMIALARETAPQARFQAGSFLKVDLPPCVAVTALGEVLNYTFDRRNQPRELARFFRGVHDALKPSGLFIFDVAGPNRELGRPPRRWSAGSDWAILLETTQRADRLTRAMTIFRKAGLTYRRSEEVHHLRLYRPRYIMQSLRKAGFSPRQLQAYGRLRLDRGLAAFVARPRA
jgi:SAM-dependent methyltransferase